MKSLLQMESQSSSANTQTSETPVLRQAIDETLHTIEQRARLYRNIVVCVAATFLLSFILAVVLWSWRPLLGVSLLVPLSGTFLVLDSRHVRLWQASILQMWRIRGLKLGEFKQVMSSFGHVPPQTLGAMLATLPANSAAPKQEKFSGEEKEALSHSAHLLVRSHERRTLLGMIALTGVVGFLVAAVIFRSGIFLICFVAMVVLWVVARRKQ